MSSNHIYPYVYRGDHPITGEFYIGSRCANTCSAELDLSIKYRTSSKTVHPRFDEFDWHIVAVFFNKTDAYDFEQSLIYEHLGTSGMLNQAHYDGKLRFSRAGTVVSPETRLKISAAKTGVHPKRILPPTFGRVASAETREKMSKSSKGKRKSIEHRENISRATTGVSRPWTVIINKDPEKIRKTAKTHTGMKRSPAACENIRLAMIKHYENKKSVM